MARTAAGSLPGRTNRKFLIVALLFGALTAVLFYALTANRTSTSKTSTTSTTQVQVVVARVPIRQILERTLAFFAEESCQKCTPCRIGTRTLRDVAAGRRRLPRLEDWLTTMEQGSICGLGQSAPTPVRDVLRFWPEVLA